LGVGATQEPAVGGTPEPANIPSDQALPAAHSTQQEATPARAEATTPETAPEAAEQPPQETTASSPGEFRPDEAPPDWVVGILEPSTAPPQAQEPYEPEELSHIMPWVHTPPDGDEEPAPPPPPGAPGLPPWLNDVTVQETLQSSAAQSTGAETGSASSPVPREFISDLDLEGIEPFVPPEVDEPAKPTAQPQQPQVQIPEWLRSISPVLGPDGPIQAEVEEQLPGPDGSIQARTTGSMGTKPQIAFQPTDTLRGPMLEGMPVRSPRPGSVETLAALLQGSAVDVTQMPSEHISTRRLAAKIAPRRTNPFIKWLLPDGLIYLVIVAALLPVLLIRPAFGTMSAPAAPDVLNFYNTIEAVAPGEPVLVVYDWDASRSAEMSILSQAVMHQLMARRLRFVTVSTDPQGPGFAQQITDEVANDPKANYGYVYGRDYLVLGYIPGNESALKALVSDFGKALPLDYVNSRNINKYPLIQGGNVRNLEDFALVVDLAADETELRNWIEQVATRIKVPIVAAVPQGLAPMARPYENVQGAGLKAVVSGPAGALQYTQELIRQRGAPGTGALGSLDSDALTDRLNTQSVAQLLVALAIVAAFISLGTRRIFRRG
jgi:hypothetical protein